MVLSLFPGMLTRWFAGTVLCCSLQPASKNTEHKKRVQARDEVRSKPKAKYLVFNFLLLTSAVIPASTDKAPVRLT